MAAKKAPEKKKNPGGRPTKLTPELQAKLVAFIRSGSYIRPACKSVGITYDAYDDWMKGSKPHHIAFQKAVEEAEGACETEAVTRIYICGQTDPDVMLRFLAKRHSARWGDKTKHTVEIRREHTAFLDRLEKVLTPEEYERALAAFVSDGLGESETEEA